MELSTKKIEMILAERNMTKTELSAMCGVSRQNISTIVRRGTCNPATAGKLARGLGVHVSDILKEVNTV